MEHCERHVSAATAQVRRGAYLRTDSWDNARRRHSKIGFMSPLRYEQRLAEQAEGNYQPARLKGVNLTQPTLQAMHAEPAERLAYTGYFERGGPFTPLNLKRRDRAHFLRCGVR
jgi:hypothetical protein